MKTEYALCYCKGKVSPGALAQVRKILAQAKPELLLDSSYFVPWLFPCRFRLFSPVSYTERPTVAAAKLCEGKIIVLVNGSPSAMILPTLFCENFDCLDDYATTAFFSSFLRILKYGAFYLSIFLPGAFVCTAVYLPELLPPVLLFKIAAAEKATPLPLFAEMVMIILILEIIREAPNTGALGQSGGGAHCGRRRHCCRPDEYPGAAGGGHYVRGDFYYALSL